MDRPRTTFDRFLPPGGGASMRTMLMSFGLWPLAMVLLLRGFTVGFGTIGLMAAPASVVAFARIRELFPPSAQRTVLTGYSAFYILITVWVVLAHFSPIGLLFLVVLAAWTIRALMRPTEDGRSTLQAMADRANAQWDIDHAPPDDNGRPGTSRFHWPDA